MADKKGRPLRSGYTTGACAAATAKAAAHLFLTGKKLETVEIPFPDGSRHSFNLVQQSTDAKSATVCTIKDAGDDPDVTNRAMICATAERERADAGIDLGNIHLFAGKGVGQVTKPGLAIVPGEAAINPVPRQMIAAAVGEAQQQAGTIEKLAITITVPQGELLASKTLNARLGVLGGISILGSTGIVRPVSASAWKATISASMDVARSAGLSEIVISTGRTSERGAQHALNLPEEAYAMMGDYLHFSLREAAKKGFRHIHYAGMWAKVMKAALAIPQTHVRNGALEVQHGAELLRELGASAELCQKFFAANTAREMLTHIEEAGDTGLIRAVCRQAQSYCQKVSQVKVTIYLINHKAEIVHHE